MASARLGQSRHQLRGPLLHEDDVRRSSIGCLVCDDEEKALAIGCDLVVRAEPPAEEVDREKPRARSDRKFSAGPHWSRSQRRAIVIEQLTTVGGHLRIELRELTVEQGPYCWIGRADAGNGLTAEAAEQREQQRLAIRRP
jgi:hypothetical protein